MKHVHTIPVATTLGLCLCCFALMATIATAAEVASDTPAVQSEESRQEQIDERREARATTLSTIAQTRLTNLAANVSNRYDAYVRRLTNITDRLDSRLAKMAAAGYDTTAAATTLATARVELTTAENLLRNIDTEVAAFIGSSNPRESWQNLKTSYTTARDSIKAAHAATVETLLLLKSSQTLPSTDNTTASST